MPEGSPDQPEPAQQSDESEIDDYMDAFDEATIARVKASLEDVAAGRVRRITAEQLIEEMYRT